LPVHSNWFHWFAPAWPAQPPAFLLAASAVALITLMAFAAYAVWREE
jgi:hypothetical protein